jgi:protein-tyrosine phosphatase
MKNLFTHKIHFYFKLPSIIQALMYEIIPNLYLSNFKDAINASKSQSFFQINVTKEHPMFQENNHRIAINDDQSTQSFVDLLQALPDTMKIIDSQLENGTVVVVHCLAGQQRSAAVISAYLLYKNIVHSLVESIQYLRNKKSDAFFWGVNFRQPLEIWSGIQPPYNPLLGKLC